jgi:hypothetical protein
VALSGDFKCGVHGWMGGDGVGWLGARLAELAEPAPHYKRGRNF